MKQSSLFFKCLFFACIQENLHLWKILILRLHDLLYLEQINGTTVSFLSFSFLFFFLIISACKLMIFLF